MKLITEKKELQAFRFAHKFKHKIALIPTMGNLHAGHLELVKRAKATAEIVMVSIFVNPLQFAPNEDFTAYPRTLQKDLDKLSQLQVEYVFTPLSESMYSTIENQTSIQVKGNADKYCGHFRPHFFTGVATVVTKLFNLIQPDIAVFGEKDFQQLYVIKKIVADLDFPIEILSVPTVREKDGLAMSSRNQYLNPKERSHVCLIYQTLNDMAKRLSVSTLSHQAITQDAISSLEAKGFKVEYISICNPATLDIASVEDKELIILVAAWIGKTRLIDNLLITLEK